MPTSILDVQLTDTFEQWREKTNQMIDQVNGLTATGQVVVLTNPVNGNVLVWNGTSFQNVAMHGVIQIDSTGATSFTTPVGATAGRIFFTGASTNLY